MRMSIAHSIKQIANQSVDELLSKTPFQIRSKPIATSKIENINVSSAPKYPNITFETNSPKYTNTSKLPII